MTEHTAYPLRLDSRLDPPLSRGLWLVKWLLAVPHYLVLGLLWVAFAVLTVVAFFAVLVTGRYPVSILSFNVGVLRWTWRVAHYSYGALGTDRYPPFTLADVPDYPARLDVEAPPQLSRGLVLVKWWLLALPHYVVVGLLVGGGSWVVARSDPWLGTASNGLIGVLVLVAGVVLLFTGRYPQGLYDLVVGLQRWVFRVVAYAALMTDVYPPFRLDLGGTDPGTPAVPGGPGGSAGDTGVAPPPVRVQPGAWTGGRVAALVAGALLVLTSVGLLGGGGAALWADQTQRDQAGYVSTGSRDLSTPTSVLLLTPLDITLDRPADALWLQRTLGSARLQVEGTGGKPLFVGLAPTDDVARYLAGVSVDRLRDVSADGGDLERMDGSRRPAPPAAQSFWTASTTGTGPLELTLQPHDGRWSAVVMAADGSPALSVRARVGAELPVLTGLSVGLLVAGTVLLVGGLALVLSIVAAVGRSASRLQGRDPSGHAVPGPRAPSSPAPGQASAAGRPKAGSSSTP